MKQSHAPNWTIFLATGLGTGYSPFASGTVGAFLALIIHAALHWTFPHGWLIDVAALAVLLPLGWYVSNFAEGYFGKKDDGRVVIDEVAGYWVTMAFVPLSWVSILVGFIVCRILDIIKPPPANKSQKLPKGLGIMADDVIAGIYGNILLQIIFRWFF